MRKTTKKTETAKPETALQRVFHTFCYTFFERSMSRICIKELTDDMCPNTIDLTTGEKFLAFLYETIMHHRAQHD
jgi:hypothetical protein